MKISSIGVAFLFGLISFDGVLGLRGQRRASVDPTDDQTVHCHVIPVDVQQGAGVADSFKQRDYRCVTSIIDEGDNSPDMAYPIEIPPELDLSEEDLNSGNIELTISHVNKTRTPGTDEDSVQLTAASQIEVINTNDERRRGLATKTKGNVKLLVVRVNGPDMSPSLSASEMSDKFFGTSGDTVSMASVYKECSHGQFVFEPANGTGIINGVGEILLTTATQGTSPWALENIVTAAAKTKFGALSSFDHVAFCFPPGTSYPGVGTGWAAYAFIGEYRSFFNDKWCSYVTAQVHEIGHNLKLDHSNEDGDYGDGSSIMGFSYPYDDFPTMCFNGAKHWYLGWYDDRKEDITLTNGPWVGNVVAFVDYMSATGADKVVLKVGNYYIQYNRAKGINSGTQEKRDEITVTEAASLVKTSESITGLSESSKYFIFQIGGAAARVEFCNAFTQGGADKVKLSVYLESQGSACDAQVPTPVPAPTSAAPVQSPTLRPKSVPKTISLTSSVNASSTCVDNETATFAVGVMTRSCLWLSTRTSIQNQVCREGSVAWEACPVTCNSCVVSTEIPTLSPVPDPTSMADCASEEMFFQLFLKTDLDPDETRWTLTSFDGSYAVAGQNYSIPEHSITVFKCLPRNHYQFVIYDEGNDGLMDGHGSYSILLDGAEIQSGGSFEHAEDTYIQPPCGVDSATLNIDLTTDVYGNETSWTLRTIGEKAPLLAVSGGPYSFLERYLIADCVPVNACYEFAIKDAQGDGLCCDYGEGSYMLTFNDKIVRSGRFSSGYEEVTTFGHGCVGNAPETVVSASGSPVVDPDAKKKAYDEALESGIFPAADYLISEVEELEEEDVAA